MFRVWGGGREEEEEEEGVANEMPTLEPWNSLMVLEPELKSHPLALGLNSGAKDVKRRALRAFLNFHPCKW